MTESSYRPNLSPASRSDDAEKFGDHGHGHGKGNGNALHQQPLTDRMAQGAHHTVDRLAQSAGPHLERIEGALAGATGHLKDQARHVREKGDEWADDMRASVRRNPLSTVLAAVAIGALIARITR